MLERSGLRHCLHSTTPRVRSDAKRAFDHVAGASSVSHLVRRIESQQASRSRGCVRVAYKKLLRASDVLHSRFCHAVAMADAAGEDVPVELVALRVVAVYIRWRAMHEFRRNAWLPMGCRRQRDKLKQASRAVRQVDNVLRRGERAEEWQRLLELAFGLRGKVKHLIAKEVRAPRNAYPCVCFPANPCVAKLGDLPSATAEGEPILARAMSALHAMGNVRFGAMATAPGNMQPRCEALTLWSPVKHRRPGLSRKLRKSLEGIGSRETRAGSMQGQRKAHVAEPGGGKEAVVQPHDTKDVAWQP